MNSTRQILARSREADTPWVLERWKSPDSGRRMIGVRSPSATTGSGGAFEPSAPARRVSHSITEVTAEGDADARATIIYGATTLDIAEVRLHPDRGIEIGGTTVAVPGEDIRAFAFLAPEGVQGMLVGLTADGQELHRRRISDRRAEQAALLDSIIESTANLSELAAGEVGGIQWRFFAGHLGGQIHTRVVTTAKDGGGGHTVGDDRLREDQALRIFSEFLSSPQIHVAVGLVKTGIAGVIAATEDGQRLRATIVPWSHVSDDFFVAAAAGSRIVEVVAHDDQGQRIDREASHA